LSISPLPSGKWRTQLRHKNFPRFDEVHPTREVAEAAEAAELARRRGTVSEGPNMLLRDAIAGYKRSEHFIEKAPRTKRSYSHALDEVSKGLGEYTLGYLGGKVSVITGYRDSRRSVISERTGKPLGADAVRIELSALSQVFSWAIEAQLFTHNPVRLIQRKRGAKRKRRLHPDELNNLKMLSKSGIVPEHRTYARFLMIQLELYCRPGELAKVLVSDIDLAERNCIFRDTKNGEDRNVYISDAAAELLAEQLVQAAVSNSPYLFHTVSRTGKLVEFNYAWWHKQFRKFKFVGPGFVPHVMRKESISSALESSMSVPTVKLMTGHKSMKAVEDYAIELEMSDYAKDIVEQHSKRQLLESDADLNNQLPPAVALARAKQTIAALPTELQKKLVAELSATL
jgi:integrase